MSLLQKSLIMLIVVLLVQLGLTMVLSSFQFHAGKSIESIQRGFRISVATMSSVGSLLEFRQLAQKGLLASSKVEEEMVWAKARLTQLATEEGDHPDRLKVIHDASQKADAMMVPLASFRRMLSEGRYTPVTGHALFEAVSQPVMDLLHEEHQMVGFMQQEQSDMKSTLQKQQAELRSSIGILYGGIAAELLLIVGAVALFRQDVSRRMNIIAANTERLGSGVPLLPRVPGNDEIGDLDAAFHKMAAAVMESAQVERDLLDKQLDVICRVDEDLQFVELNQASEAAFGIAPTALIGKAISEIIVAHDLTSAVQHFRDSKDAGQAPFEAKARRGDGSVVEMLWTVRWSDRSFFCVARDISDLKQVERLRQEVMQMVSHDIRSPLTTVSAFLDLFKTPLLGELSPDGQHLVEGALCDVRRMSMMINNLLDMEKVEAGMMQLQREQSTLESVLDAATEETAPMFKQAGVTVRVKPSDESVNVDQGLMVRGLSGLMLYAAERSMPNSFLDVKSAKVSGFVEIEISDSGSVISEAMALDLFSRFHPDDDAGGKERIETNFGLALCKALIELHGGSIVVKSSDDARTTFCLSLPS